MWLHAPNIKCVHGFSSRHGGVSQAPFSSLNLGGPDDSPGHIAQNRQIALNGLGLATASLCSLKQIHSNIICVAGAGQQQGDALVSDQKGKALAISIADCYPILFYDEANQVIGAAHAGWRGTVARIAKNTVSEMQKLGAEPANIQVAIGQGICQDNFEVGPEVLEQFEKAGFSNTCWNGSKIDLAKCNRQVLLESGIPGQNIWTMNRCTFEDDFFSYRRDKGLTGRMWGLISMQ